MTSAQSETSRDERSKTFTEIGKHPLVLLLIGTLLGSLIIPYLKDRETRNRELTNLRVEKAFAAFNANKDVNADLNGMMTGFENLLKARINTLEPERDHDLQRQIYGHHTAFNRDAWWWFPQLITEVQLFGLLDSESAAEARVLAKKYDAELVATTKTLEPFWLLMESEPVLSPPDKLGKLGKLLYQVREANRENTRKRLKIVNDFAALILNRPSQGILVNSDISPNPADRSDG